MYNAIRVPMLLTIICMVVSLYVYGYEPFAVNPPIILGLMLESYMLFKILSIRNQRKLNTSAV